MIAKRLQAIVDIVFDGSSHAAALAANMDPSTLHRILEGGVRDPRLTTVQLFAKAYGVPAAWLIGDLTDSEAAERYPPAGYASKEAMPFAYWLIYCFHREEQQTNRAWLAQAPRTTAELRNIIDGFAAFRFVPIAKDFPIPAATALFKRDVEVSDADLAIIRKCAELETALIERAVSVAAKSASDTKRTRA